MSLGPDFQSASVWFFLVNWSFKFDHVALVWYVPLHNISFEWRIYKCKWKDVLVLKWQSSECRKKLKSKVKYLLMFSNLNFYEHQPQKSSIDWDLIWSLDEHWFLLFLLVLFSPDSLLGCLLLVLLLEYGELVGEVLLANSHGVAPHVCILSNTNETTQRNKGTYGKVVEVQDV